VAFAWRVELHRLQLESCLDPGRAEQLLEQAVKFGSAKYRALALGHLGRREEAATVASTTGSALLLAHVAPEAVAIKAAERVACGLRPEQRSLFVERGGWRSDR
jgi:hypothetical protein